MSFGDNISCRFLIADCRFKEKSSSFILQSAIYNPQCFDLAQHKSAIRNSSEFRSKRKVVNRSPVRFFSDVHGPAAVVTQEEYSQVHPHAEPYTAKQFSG